MTIQPARLLPPLALAAMLAVLPACQGEPSPAMVPVQTTGAPTSTVGGETPDEYIKQLAFAGAHLASLLGETLPRFGPLLGGYFDAEIKHHRPGYRVLSGVPGWEYRHGWYWETPAHAESTLRVQFENHDGQAPSWDVTLDDNYGPELHEAFPTDLVRFRMVVDAAMRTGGRMGVTLLAVIPPDKNGKLEVFGSGSATAPGSLGTIGFEALNATFTVSGPVERGDLVLKLMRGGATYQFSGKFADKGLSEYAKVYRNGQAIGEVGHLDGKWQVFNEGGKYPVE